MSVVVEGREVSGAWFRWHSLGQTLLAPVEWADWPPHAIRLGLHCLSAWERSRERWR